MHRILRELDRRLAQPFIWGKNDCFTLFIKMVELLCGIEHKIPVEGSKILGYNGPIEGYKRLRSLGYTSIYEFARKYSYPIKLHQVRSYDFALMNLPEGVDHRIVSPMIVIGRHVYGINEHGRVVGSSREAVEFIRPCLAL